MSSRSTSSAMRRHKVLVVLGTRPEAIKLAPLVREMRRHSQFRVHVCATAQHRHMLDQVLRPFDITPEYDLHVTRPGQSLEDATSRVLTGQKVDELERTLSELELNKSYARVNSSPWWEKALFVITVFISVIPVYFVVQDRWFEKLISITAIDELWWSIVPLRTLGYPRYFLIIFLITVATALIVLFWGNKPLLVFSNLSLGKPLSSGVQVDQQQSRIGRYLLISALVIAAISAGFVFIKGHIPGWDLVLALTLYILGRVLMEYPLEGFKQHLQKHTNY